MSQIKRSTIMTNNKDPSRTEHEKPQKDELDNQIATENQILSGFFFFQW